MPLFSKIIFSHSIQDTRYIKTKMPVTEIAIGITLGLGSVFSFKKYADSRAVIQPVQAAQVEQHVPRAEEPVQTAPALPKPKPKPTHRMSDFDRALDHCG